MIPRREAFRAAAPPKKIRCIRSAVGLPEGSFASRLVQVDRETLGSLEVITSSLLFPLHDDAKQSFVVEVEAADHPIIQLERR